jgi:hypothetical protein
MNRLSGDEKIVCTDGCAGGFEDCSYPSSNLGVFVVKGDNLYGTGQKRLEALGVPFRSSTLGDAVPEFEYDHRGGCCRLAVHALLRKATANRGGPPVDDGDTGVGIEEEAQNEFPTGEGGWFRPPGMNGSAEKASSVPNHSSGASIGSRMTPVPTRRTLTSLPRNLNC